MLESIFSLGKSLQKGFVKRRGSKFRNKFESISKHETTLMNMFLSQLGCEQGDEWIFPAFAVIIPTVLYAHTDTKNPSQRDITVQVNVSLPLSTLDQNLMSKAKKIFGESIAEIPISVLFYQKDCIFRYVKIAERIENYPFVNGKVCIGRKTISNIMSKVGSEYDYRLRYFTKLGYKRFSEKCSDTIHNLPDMKVFVSDESIDRGVSIKACELW